VRTEEEKDFYEKFRLKPMGGWTVDVTRDVNNHFLAEQHWKRVKEFIKKHPPPEKGGQKAMEDWYKKAIMTPEQEVVMWSEASLQAPLNHEGFARYMQVFEQVVGKEQFKAIHGGMDAKDVTKVASRQMQELMKNSGYPLQDTVSSGLETPYQREQRRLREYLDKHPGPYDLWSDFTNKSELGRQIKEKRLQAERESRNWSSKEKKEKEKE
jgi:hypothetical protein